MKIQLIMLLFVTFFVNAQERNNNFLKIPVDKFKGYENCCLNRCNMLLGLITPVENELRIYGYKNESNVKAYKPGIITKIIKNSYDKSEVILVKSNDIIFVYKNLTNVKVNVHDKISENQILGQILTINSENYLGFEIWNKNAEKLDPIKYLKNDL